MSPPHYDMIDMPANVKFVNFISFGLPAAVFPSLYGIDTFKKRIYLHLKGRRSTCSPLLLHRVVGDGDHLSPGDP